jgi:hypothetical protein
MILAPVILALGALLTTAATVPPPRPPGPDEGLVYFYNTIGAKPTKIRTMIKVDGRMVAYLEVRQHTRIYLKPGEHTLQTSGGGLFGPKFPIEVVGGQTHYIRFVGEGIGSIIIPDVTEPPVEEAKAELKGSAYVKPKKEWLK